MNLKEWHSVHVSGLKKTTLGIIRNSADQICLAMKKRGFGEGKWNFSGGKVQAHETAEQAHARETLEEFQTRLGPLRLVAILYFYFSDVPVEKGWNQKCFVFVTDEWQGEPQESDEMLPKWWRRDEIPYHDMWQEDKSWIEPVLDGQVLTGFFLFTSKDECLEQNIVLGQIIDE